MQLLRSLGIFLIACGLFVQSAAHASAMPQAPAGSEAACNEMRMETGATTASEDQPGPCKNLRLDCLVALGCIAPLAMITAPSGERTKIAVRSLFTPFAAYSPALVDQGPEPPPPQEQF